MSLQRFIARPNSGTLCPEVIEGKIYAVKLIRTPWHCESGKIFPSVISCSCMLMRDLCLSVVSRSIPDEIEIERRTFPVVLKYHLTEDGCNPQILITQLGCKQGRLTNLDLERPFLTYLINVHSQWRTLGFHEFHFISSSHAGPKLRTQSCGREPQLLLGLR